MNRMQRMFGVLVFQALAIGVPLFVCNTHVAYAEEPGTCQFAPRALDRTLVAKNAEGDASLRRFIERTQTVYGLNMDEAKERVEHVRVGRAACDVAQVASARVQ